MILARRSFIAGLASLLASPAIIKADTLMKVGNIDHLLYPIRGLVIYSMMRDQLIVRIDRANIPINMQPKNAHKILTNREINLLFTKDQIAAILPNKPMQQLGMDKIFSTREWVEKGLLPTTT